MPQQIEVEPVGVRAPVPDARRAGPSKSENAPRSAKRFITTFIVALVFAFAVIVGLVYLVNSAAYQSRDDAFIFIDGHIIPVSSQVAGRVQSVYVDDNQSVNKGDLVVELDPRDFELLSDQRRYCFRGDCYRQHDHFKPRIAEAANVERVPKAN